MVECPCCFGEGGFDLRSMDAPLKRLCRVFRAPYVPMGIVQCDVCEGVGDITEAELREFDAWAVARVDQLLAAVDSGEVKVP